MARTHLASGQSLLELAVLEGSDPWSLVLQNGLSGTSMALPGNILRSEPSQGNRLPGLPAAIMQVEVEPLQMVQGGTTVIKVYAPAGISYADRWRSAASAFSRRILAMLPCKASTP